MQRITKDTEQTRATLLLRLRENGPAREFAWQDFFELYNPIISAFARRSGENPQEADELVQDVMHAFFRASLEFDNDPPKGRFRGYLKTCVCNKLKSLRARTAKFRDAPPLAEVADELAAETTWNDVWETEKLHRAVALVRQRYATNAD